MSHPRQASGFGTDPTPWAGVRSVPTPRHRLARDLTAAGAPGARATPWGVEYDQTIVATAVPPTSTWQHWEGRTVLAASATVRVALAEAGMACADNCDPPLLPIPDGSLRAGAHSSGVVRCDDEGSSLETGLAIGAFLLGWTLDAPHARLTVDHQTTAAVAATLGCIVESSGPAPVVVLCAGAAAYPPALVVDALAAGIPVAGLRTPALAEVIGTAGLLVDLARGVEALGAALGALLNDAELAADIGGRGPGRIEQLAPGEGLRDMAQRLA